METSKEEEIIKDLGHAEQISGDECRICLRRCRETCQLFRNNGEISQKLMALAAVQIQEADGLPTAICLSCYHLLDISYDFKCQIERSDAKLRQILKFKSPGVDNSKDTTIVKNILTDVMSSVIPNKNNTQNVETIHLLQDGTTIQSNHTAVQPALELNLQAFATDQNVVNSHTGERNSNESSVNNCGSIFGDKDKIIENVTKDDDLKNCEISECEELLLNQQNQLSTQARCIKEEEVSLPGGNELLGNGDILENNAIHKEQIFKIEIKNDVPLDDIDNVFSGSMTKALDENCDEKSGNNCSDDEEKPLICRTSRQRCPHCIKSFATKLALQRHMIVHKHKTKLRYVCYICDKQFSNIAKLKSHVFNNHDAHKTERKLSKDNVKEEEKEMQEKKLNKDVSMAEKSYNNSVDSSKAEKKGFKFTCKVCSKQFTYQKPFLTHAKSHPEYKSRNLKAKLKASVCKENDSNEDEPDDEDEEEEDDDDSNLPVESLQCTQCGKLFATKRNLKRHISTHSGLKFNCSTCGKAFSRIDKLKDHEQSKHKEEMFGNSDDEAENDTDNENKINDNTENRKKDRHNRPHKCAMCPKAFAQAQSLANHMERHKRVKDTQKRFLCEVCSKCFAQSGSLVAHMRTHTGVKPYVCNICSRAFTKSTYLQLHLRTHSGEKPYICQYCSRAFARANTLARHITMHTGEAKYHCQICTKSFRRLTSLNEHTYTHTGQRPYACKICTKRYNNAGSLYAHTKKCKAQQLSGSTTTFTVSMENSAQPNGGAVPQVLIYSQRKLVEEATVGQVTPTPQYMIANVHNQKTLPTNIIQPFGVDDPNVYTVNSKQFKNPYYTIYPNM